MDQKLTHIWNNVLADIKTQVSPANFGTLFQPTFLVSLEDDIATIAAPSPMILNLIQTRFSTQIKELLQKQTGKDTAVLFILKAKPQEERKKEQAMGPLFSEQKPVVKPVVGHLPRVRPDYTFDNFAVSSTNQLAFVSAQTVASNIGKSYNPLFIYGPVGVGKTHLMHAVANTVYNNNPEKKIIYITSEEFTNDVVEAIRGNDTARMKKRFRSAYLLVIDDIQFIEGKERVQEELFHTFNILIDNGSQICLTSDRPPNEIKKLEKRLSSRFAGGLTVDVGKPDLELKTAILLKKAEKFGQILPMEVALFLADNAEDTRSLEGLLLRVITQATTTHEDLSLELAKKALGTVVQERERNKPRIHADDIIDYVCSYYHIKTSQLKGPKREASLVRARQVAMYLLKHELGMTTVDIGNLLGGRDHTTIIHGVDKIEKLVDKEPKLSEDILGITRFFRG